MRYGLAPLRARLIQDPDFGMSETADTVFVADDGVPTGLLSADGLEIYRYRNPIGFKISREDS